MPVEQGEFTARLPDIPAYGEGETADEAIADLKRRSPGMLKPMGSKTSRIKSLILLCERLTSLEFVGG